MTPMDEPDRDEPTQAGEPRVDEPATDEAEADVPASDEAALEELLLFLRDSRGFDFTGYKRSSLARRIRKRMQEVRIDSFADYRDRLEIDADEFGYLFNTILINVTSFFRDTEAWRLLEDEIVPELVDRAGPDHEFRVWSAGCSSGQEAYSLAMVFCEVLGTAQFVERVKIYGTDVDDEALREARNGTFTTRELESLPPGLREKYFEQTGRSFTFRTDLRRRVIFGRHDLTRDAPISRLDLLACRNTLMYFNVEAQVQIIDRLHFALNPGPTCSSARPRCCCPTATGSRS